MVFDGVTATDIFEELRFILELTGGEFLFALTCCKKRDHFLIRAGLGMLGLLICSMSYFVLRYYTSDIGLPALFLALVYISFYTVLTLLTTGYLYLCFDFTLDQAIFHTIGGYAIQHISYVIFTELMARTWFTQINDIPIAYISFAVFGYVLICLACYFLFIRNFKNVDYVYFLTHKKSYFYFGMMLIVTVFLTFAGQTIYQNSSSKKIVENPNYLGAAVSLLTCVLLLALINMLYMDNQQKREKDLVDQMLYEQKKQYEYKKETTESFKKLAHDMKHQLLAVSEESQNKNEILSNMEKEISAYDAVVDTGNEALNIILMDKIISTRNDQIRIEFDGDSSLLSFMETVDVFVFLGNALDNAIEAIKRSQVSNRNISLSVKAVKGVVSVFVSNYFDGKVSHSGTALQTSKENKDLHGIGMKSMKEIVEKYNGKLTFEATGQLFTLKAIFIRS